MEPHVAHLCPGIQGEGAHDYAQSFPCDAPYGLCRCQNRGNRELAAEAWDELWHVWHNDKPFTVRRVEVPEVPAPVDENPVVCTNDAATWSLAAIYMQEVIPE